MQVPLFRAALAAVAILVEPAVCENTSANAVTATVSFRVQQVLRRHIIRRAAGEEPSECFIAPPNDVAPTISG